MSSRKRVRSPTSDDEDEVWLALLKVQRLSGCPTKTLHIVREVLEPYLSVPVGSGVERRRTEKTLLQRSGAKLIKLHGCVGANCIHIFVPEDKNVLCPRCGKSRYDVKGKPNEVCFYFPLRDQLRSLLSIPAYREWLLHEWRRSKSPDYMSDVYDAPRWTEKMGEPTETLERIGLQLCIDGVPAHARKNAGSVKPIQYVLLSLPPWMRYQAINMINHMLIISDLKGVCARKYYDWAATYEMNHLHTRGVDGVRVVLYGTTLDTPGRREILAMQTETAFYPCPHCLHTWQPGLRDQTYNGYRRFLELSSGWRKREFVYRGHKYMFRDAEERDVPKTRTDENVATMVGIARPKKPCCGHKGLPFLSRWIGADWDGQMCDMMHDLKCFCEMLLKGLVGNGSGMFKGWGVRDQHHRY